MATVVNIKGRDPFAGFGQAFQQQQSFKKQQELQSEGARLALEGKIAGMNAEVGLKREEQERKEALIAQLVQDVNAPAEGAAPEGAVSEFGVPQFKDMQVETFDGKGPIQPENVDTSADARRKLGAKGLTTSERFPGMAVTPATALNADQLASQKATAAQKANADSIKLQKDTLAFKDAQSKSIAKSDAIGLGTKAIERGGLFPQMRKDDPDGAAKHAAWLADSNPALLNLIISGEGKQAWIKKSALTDGNIVGSFVPIGTKDAIGIKEFTRLYSDAQGGIPDSVKTDRINFSGWAAGQGFAKSDKDFVSKYPVGSERYNRIKGWHQYRQDLREHTQTAFQSGQAKVDGWNQIPGLDETSFRIAYQGAFQEIVNLLAEGDYAEGIEIPKADDLANNLASVMHAGLSDAFTGNTSKADRRKAVKAYLSPKNMTSILFEASDGLRDAEGNLQGDAQTTMFTQLDNKYGQDAVVQKTPGNFQDTMAFAAKARPGIFADPANLSRYEENLVKAFPDDEAAIRSTFKNPDALLMITLGTSGGQ